MKRAFRHLLEKRRAGTQAGTREDAPDTPAALLARVRDRDFWRALDPALPLEGPPPPKDAFAPPAIAAEALRASIAEDGYARTGPLVPAAALDRALHAAHAVQHAGFPFVFAYVFDAVWDALRASGVIAALSALLGEGHRQLPGIWLHAVPAHRGAHGWGPHVDVARPPRLLPDGRADRLTAWLPLTDTSVEDACISVVPASALPPGFAARFEEHETLPMDLALRLLHAARPLPAPRGALLTWRFDVLHWGGFHTGTTPRLALSLEYLHEDEQPTLADGFALDARSRPPFEQRLALIGRALLAYGKAEEREPFARRFLGLAERLYRG